MFMHKQPNSSELLPPWIVCIWKLRHTLETLKRRKIIIWIKYEICKWKTKGFFLNEHLDVYADEQLKLLKPWFCKSVRHSLKTLKRRKNNMNEIIICKQNKQTKKFLMRILMLMKLNKQTPHRVCSLLKP